MKTVIHAIAGAMAITCIAIFWISTAVSELFLDYSAVASVKQAIVYGLFLLVPCMAATGGSGFVLSRLRTGIALGRKKKRMAVICANGLLLMIPMAIFLNAKASTGDFDSVFYAVQVFELIVGALQLTLMSMNFRDGLKLTGEPRVRTN